MPRSQPFSLRNFALLTTLPALAIGAVLWFAASLVPACEIDEASRLPSPDGVFDLVTFSRDCGATTGSNTQLALIPAGELVPDDAASFVSVGAAAMLDAQWTADGAIAVTLPPDATVYRQDRTVAGIAVRYR